MKRRKPITVRMLEEIREAVEKAAKASNRSMSSYLETMLIIQLKRDGFLN